MTQIYFVLYTVAMDGQTYGIIGAAFEVHKRLGAGFLEAVYKEALSSELVERGIPFSGEAEVPVLYKGHKLKTSYRADFVCYNSIIVEPKANSTLGTGSSAQLFAGNRIPESSLT